MIYNLMILAAVINVILGVLALVKGRNRLNLSFFALSMIFAAWNLCVVLWQGYGLDVFSRVNFVFVCFIPPVSLYFVMSLFDVNNGDGPLLPSMLRVYFTAAACWALYTGATFFSPGLLELYHSSAMRLSIFISEFVTLGATFAVLIGRYHKIKFKQEKTKVGYVILAFGILEGGRQPKGPRKSSSHPPF